MPNRMFGDPATLESDATRMVAVVSKPSLGRIVYYYSRASSDGLFQSEAHPAMVTAVTEVGTSLAVFHPTGVFFDADVHYSPTPAPGCWTWPPLS